MKTKSRTTRLVVGVFVLVLLAVTLVPLAWVVISSFKTQGEMLITPWALPKEWKFSNYAEAWQRGKFLQLMKNSVVITAGSLIFMVLFPPWRPMASPGSIPASAAVRCCICWWGRPSPRR